MRLGENEIEVDSRDIYVDNQTLGDVIDGLSQHLSDSRAKIIYSIEEVTAAEDDEPVLDEPIPSSEIHIPAVSEEPQDAAAGTPVLAMLDDAEVYEPEFAEPENIPANKIPSKLLDIEAAGFFEVPRTVTETVQHMRERGWAASSLDVSKAMVAMAVGRKLVKNSVGSPACYTSQKPLFVS